MSVVVGAQGTLVTGVNATLSINGLARALATSFSAKWGNELEEAGRSSTDIPIILTGKYHGEADMDVMYSTENTVLSTTTSGTSSAGQAVLTVLSTIGFAVGQVVTINPGGTDSETGVILSIQAGASFTLTTNLVNSHSTGETVTVNNEQFASLLQPKNGSMLAIGLTWTGKDPTGTVRTFTLTGTGFLGAYPKQTEWSVSGEKVAHSKVSFIFNARPTLT